jgi:hypothetical protein
MIDKTVKSIVYLLSLWLSIGINAQNTTVVTGYVYGVDDQLPIADAVVGFHNTAITTVTDSNGYFRLVSSHRHKTLVVERLGYDTKNIKLPKDIGEHTLQIALYKQSNVLQEVAISPPKNLMKEILRKVHKNKKQNIPENLWGFSSERTETNKLYLTNINRKILKAKIFSGIRQNAIYDTDSTVIVPVHFSDRRDLIKFSETDTALQNIVHKENTLDILRGVRLTQIMSVYAPKVNFYDDGILLLEKMFVSPLSQNGMLFYDYEVKDSTLDDYSRVYFIRFKPKNDKLLTFTGNMQIEGGTYALKYINASITSSANVNFVRYMIFNQSFARLSNGRYFYTSDNSKICFMYDFPFSFDAEYLSAVLDRSVRYANTHSIDRGQTIDTIPDMQDEADTNLYFAASVENLNNTKLQKTIHYIVDVLINSHIPMGKLDIGNIFSFVRYNAVEGFRPTFGIRTSEKLCRWFTAGGYFGYGFDDRQPKYGANAQFFFGKDQSHYLGVFYNNDVYRLGYDTKKILAGKLFVGSDENLLTSVSWGQRYNQLLHKRNAIISYCYERNGLKLSVIPSISEIYANRFVRFVRNGNDFSKINTASLVGVLRLSFDQEQLKTYFRSFYLSTQLPVITLLGEVGGYRVGDKSGRYAKLTAHIKYNFAFALGKVYFSAYGTKIWGRVPYILLEQPIATQGLWHNSHSFDLINQTEFLSDLYGAMFFRYYSNGLIFSHIPFVKEFNFRETAFCNVAWGAISPRHAQVLDFPLVEAFDKPYVEAGVGIANILNMLIVESVWRITHRHAPNALNWGLRVKFYMDF